MLSPEHIGMLRERLSSFIMPEELQGWTILVPNRDSEEATGLIIQGQRDELYCVEDTMSPIHDEMRLALCARAYADRVAWGRETRQQELLEAEAEHLAGAKRLRLFTDSEDDPGLPLSPEDQSVLAFQMGELSALTDVVVAEIQRLRELTGSFADEPAIIYFSEITTVEYSFRVLYEMLVRIDESHKSLVSYWVYSGRFTPEEIAADPALEAFLVQIASNELELADDDDMKDPKALAEEMDNLALQIRAGFQKTL